MDMDTLLYFTWRTSKDLLDSTGNSAQSSVITLWSPGGRMGEGIVRESGMDMDTLLCLTRRTSKDLLSSSGNSAQCHVAAWMEGSLGEDGSVTLRVLVAQSCLTLCYPMNTARQASVSITNSQSSLRLTSIESVMPCSHLILTDISYS